MIGSDRHSPVLPGCVQGAVSGWATALHMKPPSSVQVFEQPSPSSRLPSSQASPISTAPLPQLMAHAPVVAPVRQLGSLVQVFEQPDASPKNRPFGPAQPAGHGAVRLVPQSQPSLPSFMPLPQMDALQTLGMPVQLAPGSI